MWSPFTGLMGDGDRDRDRDRDRDGEKEEKDKEREREGPSDDHAIALECDLNSGHLKGIKFLFTI